MLNQKIVCYLHMEFSLSLQFSSQQASLSSLPNSPASHSSSPSTRRLPQKLSSGSVKHREDLASRTFRINRKEQGENLGGNYVICVVSSLVTLSFPISPTTTNPQHCERYELLSYLLLLTSYPDTLYVYMR